MRWLRAGGVVRTGVLIGGLLAGVGLSAPAWADTAPVCQIVSPSVVLSNTGGLMRMTLDGSRSYDPSGAALTYAWTTNGPVTLDNPAAAIVTQTGNFFQAGALVTWTTTLTVSNGVLSSSCDAQMSVVDNLPPAFTTLPSNVRIEADASTTANVNAWLNNVAAVDPAAPAGTSVAISNNFTPAAGIGGVGVGNTVQVTWSAQDVDDPSAMAQVTATLTVVDTTPPILTLPDAVTVDATGPTGAVVTYAATAQDFVSGRVPVDCTPVSGATFPLGTTLVPCSATDTAGNRAQGTFAVTVLPASNGGSPGGPGPNATPELDSLALFGAGLLGIGGYARTRWQARRRQFPPHG
jgi:hypothetical protein